MGSPSETNGCVLIVEDDQSLRELLRNVLTYAGYQVATATDGSSALSYLRVGPRPSLILLDLMLPGMDGWQFCEARLNDPVLSSIPVVIVSARAGPSRISPYIGVSAVVAKPFDVDQIIETVQRFSVTEPKQPIAQA